MDETRHVPSELLLTSKMYTPPSNSSPSVSIVPASSRLTVRSNDAITCRSSRQFNDIEGTTRISQSRQNQQQKDEICATDGNAGRAGPGGREKKIGWLVTTLLKLRKCRALELHTPAPIPGISNTPNFVIEMHKTAAEPMVPSLTDVVKLVLWTLGILFFFAGIATWVWWPFFALVTVFMHLRVPVPLGFAPPVYDGTIGAFVVKGAYIVGTCCLLIGLVFESWWWLIPAVFCFWKQFILSHEAEESKARFRRLNPSIIWDGERQYPRLPLLLYLHPYLLNYIGHYDLGGGVRIRRVSPDGTTTTTSSASSSSAKDHPPPITLTTSFDVWYQEKDICVGNNGSHSHQLNKKKPLFFFIHGGGWIFGESRRHTQVLLLQRLVLHGFVVVAANYRKNKWPQHIDDCETPVGKWPPSYSCACRPSRIACPPPPVSHPPCPS